MLSRAYLKGEIVMEQKLEIELVTKSDSADRQIEARIVLSECYPDLCGPCDPDCTLK